MKKRISYMYAMKPFANINLIEIYCGHIWRRDVDNWLPGRRSSFKAGLKERGGRTMMKAIPRMKGGVEGKRRKDRVGNTEDEGRVGLNARGGRTELKSIPRMKGGLKGEWRRSRVESKRRKGI